MSRQYLCITTVTNTDGGSEEAFVNLHVEQLTRTTTESVVIDGNNVTAGIANSSAVANASEFLISALSNVAVYNATDGLFWSAASEFPSSMYNNFSSWSNGTNFTDIVLPDACWGELTNISADGHVVIVEENTACLFDLPHDLVQVVIDHMTEKFSDSPINCAMHYEEDDMASFNQGMVLMFIMLLSMIGLFATVLIYFIKGDLRTLPGINLACLCISHFVHYLTGILNLFNVPHYQVSEAVCVFFGFTRNFTILATFFWLNVMAFDIWYTISRMESNLGASTNSRKVGKFNVRWKRLGKYLLYGWGMPLSIASTAVIFNWIPNMPETLRPNYRRPYLGDPDIRCTMSGNNLGSLFLFNTGPRWVVLMANVVFFVLTSRAIHQTGKQTEAMRTSNPQRARYRLYIKLFIVMGLAWALNVIEFIVHAGIGVEWVSSGAAWFSKISDFVTALIGIGIYITFGLMPTIAFARRRCGSKSTSDAARHTSTSTETGSVMSSNKFGMYGTGRNASTTSTEGSVRSSRLEMDTSHLPTF